MLKVFPIHCDTLCYQLHCTILAGKFILQSVSNSYCDLWGRRLNNFEIWLNSSNLMKNSYHLPKPHSNFPFPKGVKKHRTSFSKFSKKNLILTDIDEPNSIHPIYSVWQRATFQIIEFKSEQCQQGILGSSFYSSKGH